MNFVAVAIAFALGGWIGAGLTFRRLMLDIDMLQAKNKALRTRIRVMESYIGPPPHGFTKRGGEAMKPTLTVDMANGVAYVKLLDRDVTETIDQGDVLFDMGPADERGLSELVGIEFTSFTVQGSK